MSILDKVELVKSPNNGLCLGCYFLDNFFEEGCPISHLDRKCNIDTIYKLKDQKTAEDDLPPAFEVELVQAREYMKCTGCCFYSDISTDKKCKFPFGDWPLCTDWSIYVVKNPNITGIGGTDSSNNNNSNENETNPEKPKYQSPIAVTTFGVELGVEQGIDKETPKELFDSVSKPKHYMLFPEKDIEVRDLMKVLSEQLDDEGFSGMLVSDYIQMMQYLLRWHNKNGVEDLEKAQWYLSKIIEVLKLND